MREEIKKILWENLSVWNEGEIEESLDKITALIERESDQKFTRKQVQKACANAYQRGVDNRPYIERFDEWVEDEPNQPKSEE